MIIGNKKEYNKKFNLIIRL